MVRNSLFLLTLLMLVSSCAKTFDTVEEMNEYIQDVDNGFSQTKIINGVRINLTYKPTELMVLQEISNKNYSEKQKDSLRNKYNKYIYFILSYSKDEKEILSTLTTSREQFNTVQNTLSFRMNQNTSLINNKNDTVPLIGYNFPRTYGMSRSTNLLFVFERNKQIEDSGKFYFNLSDIGIGIGDITFKYNTSIINTTTF